MLKLIFTNNPEQQNKTNIDSLVYTLYLFFVLVVLTII